MSVEIVPTGAMLGADVRGIDVSNPVSGEDQQRLCDALATHHVLRFRGQSLSVDEHIRFAGTFGELGAIADTLLGMGKREFQPNEIPECVSVISNIKVAGEKIGSLGDGECLWHSDSCFSATPPSASLLYSIEIPADGGNTSFLDMSNALETLPAPLRARIEGLSIRHSKIYDSTGAKRAAFDEVSDVTKAPGPVHPMVRTIPQNGQKSLYLGRRLGAWIVGLEVDESEALLDELWAHTVRDERVWSHSWQLGDLVI